MQGETQRVLLVTKRNCLQEPHVARVHATEGTERQVSLSFKAVNLRRAIRLGKLCKIYAAGIITYSQNCALYTVYIRDI